MARRRILTAILSLGLLSGCAHPYPPALPDHRPMTLWSNAEAFIPNTPPPAELAYQRVEPRKHTRLVPIDSEWSLFEAAPVAKEVCRGTGKARRCTMVAASQVPQAQAQALIRPSKTHMGNGRSAIVTYTYQPGAIFVVEVSTYAGTTLDLPLGERLRMPPVLNTDEKYCPEDTGTAIPPACFAMGQDDSPEEETPNDILALRARRFPQRPVQVPLVFRSGVTIIVRFETVEGDPMTLVRWTMPEERTTAKELPVGKRPPKFNNDNAYSAYTMSVEGKDTLTPPWMPVAVADDGSNTLVKFERPLDWTRAPVVVGLAQNGKPSITPNRYFTRPDKPEEGAWLFLQGLWPAIVLKDSAGLMVKIVRIPPTQGGAHHATR